MSGRDFGTEFGLGYRIQRVGGRKLIGHDGHLAGHVTATFFDPDARLAVSAASNAKDAPILQIINGIFEAIDWFARNAPAKKNLAKFNTRLRSDTGSVEVIAGKNKIVATDPDSWRPFNLLEELERVDSKTLRIVTATSTFLTGELVSYKFDKNVIRAVRYAGLTMVPESGYVGYKLGNLKSPKSDHISIEDVKYATLKVGKIRGIELVRGKLPIRLHIDYGPKYGTSLSYLRTFPEGVSKDTIMYGLAIGALFPVWWLGKTTYRILTIGLSLDGQASPYNATNNLISLLADRDYPRVVTPKVGNQLAQEYFRQEKSELFRLQALTDYPFEDYNVGADSFSAWRKGQHIKSRSLLGNYLNDPPDWLQRRRPIIRVVITDGKLSNFQRWCVEFSRIVGIPLGETVYLVPNEKLRHISLPQGDFMISDNERAMVNSYTQNRLIGSTAYDSAYGNDLSPLLEIKNHLIAASIKYGQKITN